MRAPRQQEMDRPARFAEQDAARLF